MALAAVLPPPPGDRARQVAAGAVRSAGDPSWVDEIGRAVPSRAWVASDVFGSGLTHRRLHPALRDRHAILGPSPSQPLGAGGLQLVLKP